MVDYSHGIRLVQQRMMVNGATTTVAQVLADPKLAGLLSDEGPSQFRVIRPTPSRRHRLEKLWPPRHRVPAQRAFGERIARFAFEPQAKIHLNA